MVTKMAKNSDLGMKCIQYMLCISNFMFVLIGTLMIIIGSSVVSMYNEFEHFLEAHHFSPAVLMITIGVIVLLVAIFGCIGAMRRSTALINIYTLLLLILLILEISAAITAFVKRSNIEESIESTMFESMELYNKDIAATECWDFAQERLGCCGVHKIQDWSSHKVNGTTITVENVTLTIPNSCCATSNCRAIYNMGCLDHISYIISENGFMLGTGAVCVALVQMLGIIFGHMLAKTIRQVKTQEEMVRQQRRKVLYELHICTNDEKVPPPPHSDA